MSEYLLVSNHSERNIMIGRRKCAIDLRDIFFGQLNSGGAGILPGVVRVGGLWNYE